MNTLPIARVVVHRDGAVVTRRGTLPVVDGRVVAAGLPIGLRRESVRMKVEGGTLRSMVVGVDQAAVPGPSGAEESELLEARAAESAVIARLESLERYRQSLAGVVPAHNEEELPTVHLAGKWLAADSALQAQCSALDGELELLRAERERARDVVRAAELALKQASSESLFQRWVPSLAAYGEVEGAEELTVEVSYRVDGARWTPAYRLQMSDGGTDGRFVVRALVQQATGEDWHGVEVRLATTPCDRIVTLPKLRSQRLGARNPPQPEAYRPLPGVESLFDGPVPPPQEPEKVSIERAVPVLDLADDEEDSYGAPPARPSRKRRQTRAPAPPSGPPPAMQAAPAAFMAPRPSPAPNAMARSGGASKGGGPPPRPQRVIEHLEVEEVSYRRLRMVKATLPGRGTLQPADEASWLQAEGLSRGAVRRVRECKSRALQRCGGLAGAPLPPHHTLPGPVGGQDHVFEVAGLVDLPSDSKFHSLAVWSESCEIGVECLAVPRKDPRVYRRAIAKLGRSIPLVAGPCEVTIDGEVELTTPWSGSADRGEVRIPLGADNRFTVQRTVHYEEESAGLFGGKRRVLTSISVEIASAMPRSVSVEVRERIPVTGSGAKVTFEEISANPPTQSLEGEAHQPKLKGGVSQVVHLAPGGVTKCELTYSATMPSNIEIAGGDRRG